jgi:hypothetical protein
MHHSVIVSLPANPSQLLMADGAFFRCRPKREPRLRARSALAIARPALLCVRQFQRPLLRPLPEPTQPVAQRDQPTRGVQIVRRIRPRVVNRAGDPYKHLTGGSGRSRLEALGSLLAGFPEQFGVRIVEAEGAAERAAAALRFKRVTATPESQ